MAKKAIKMEHVERLTRGKRSGVNIGSRAVGHHLRMFERAAYERALQARYLVIDDNSRENLSNVWNKVAVAKKWSCLILIKYPLQQRGEVLLNGKVVLNDELSAAKLEIRHLAKELNH